MSENRATLLELNRRVKLLQERVEQAQLEDKIEGASVIWRGWGCVCVCVCVCDMGG